MATEQERWNQAQRNTGNAMRGTQSGGPHQAERTTGNVMHGTYPGTQPKAGFGDQAGHDKAYKEAMKGHLERHPGKKKPTADDDVGVSQELLKRGADPKKLQNSVANHSENKDAVKFSPDKRNQYGGHVVARAAKRNAQDEPRAARENVKPGHETHKGSDKPDPDKPDPKPPSPSGGGSKTKDQSVSQTQMAAWYHSQKRGR